MKKKKKKKKKQSIKYEIISGYLPGRFSSIKSFAKFISCLFDIVSHIISIRSFFVSFKVNHFSHLYDQIYRSTKKKNLTNEEKKRPLFDRAKIDTLPTLQKKKKKAKEKRTAVLVVRILECVHSLYSLIS